MAHVPSRLQGGRSAGHISANQGTLQLKETGYQCHTPVESHLGDIPVVPTSWGGTSVKRKSK